jgi:hypothetical protein
MLAGMSAAAQDSDPPPQAGRLSALKGEVSFQQAGGDQWMKARRNMPLGPGDRIYTDEKGRAEIQIGQTYLRVGPNTDVTLQSATPQDLTFALAQGAARLHTMGLWQGQALYMNTPSGSVTLNSAAQVRVDVFPEQQSAIFTDVVSAVQVSGAGDYSQGLEPGQVLELAGSNPVTPQWLGPTEPDDLDRWSHKRDKEIEQAAAYQYVSPQMSGAEELDANGTWMPGTPYGAVWYPNVAPGWVPYRNGYWANRAPWGWVWVEEEPWGYAPFHYGRWVNWGGRWAWVPGPRQAPAVWAPAQVAFVGGGNPGTSAWVPLGPGEAFWPWYRCSPGYVNQVNISNIQPAPRVVVQNVYVNRVTNVTNVTYINQTNVTVVKQEDMASGRSVSQTAIPVTPVQMKQFHALPPSAVAAPPARPIMVGGVQTQAVPVSTNRPTVINASGNAVVAQPGARPVSAPVRTPPTAMPLAGRTVVAPPPGAKMPPVQPVGTTVRPGGPGQTVPPGQPGMNAGGPVRAGYTGNPAGVGTTPNAGPGNAAGPKTQQPAPPAPYRAGPPPVVNQQQTPPAPYRTGSPVVNQQQPSPNRAAPPAQQPQSQPAAPQPKPTQVAPAPRQQIQAPPPQPKPQDNKKKTPPPAK